MELNLRRKAVGGYWGGNLGFLGQSGETETEEMGLPTDEASNSYVSGEVDLSTIADPGFNIQTTPGTPLSDAELVAEQARARSWISENFPSVISTGAKAIMSAAQIASGISAGAVKTSSTCPSGYMVSGSGACIQPQVAGAAVQLIPGLDNRSLAILGGGLLFLLLLGGKRR